MREFGLGFRVQGLGPLGQRFSPLGVGVTGFAFIRKHRWELGVED